MDRADNESCAEPALPRPFFESAGVAAPRGRLLLISYHFPPSQATGALRWQKFARFAAEEGWALDVVTLAPTSLAEPEPERLEELPPGVRVYGVPAPPVILVERIVDAVWTWVKRLRGSGRPRDRGGSRGTPRQGGEPGRGEGGGASPDLRVARPRPADLGRNEIRWLPPTSRTAIRAYSAWLDFARGARWARAAEALALRLAHSGPRPTVVISCGPPQMAHEAGRRVARALGAPFVMDLRDPWSLAPRLPESYASPLWYHLARHFERRAVNQAAESGLIVTNSDLAREAMQALYPAAAGRSITVMNGFDDDPIPEPAPGRRFLIAYTGVIYMDRNPRALFRATARLVSELGLGPAEIGIEFVGEVAEFNGISLETIAAEEGIADYVRIGPRVPRREALQLLARATLLVNLHQDAALAIPSKLFDYMRFPAWILALATRGSAPERLLRGTGADLVEPDDLEGIVAVLRTRYLQHLAGVRPPRIADEAGHYSRRAQAGLLFQALADVSFARSPGARRREWAGS